MSAAGRTVVVLGTDRGVGKTHVVCAILERTRSLGHRAIGIVPIETGCRYGDNHDLLGADGERLRASSSGPVPPLVTSPYRFAADASPADAASSSGLELELADLASAVDSAARFGTVVIVEGPHHALAPLVVDGLTIDLAVHLDAPVLIIGKDPTEVRAACEERGLRIAGILPNRSDYQAPDAYPGLGDAPTLADVKAHLEAHRIVERLIEALRPA